MESPDQEEREYDKVTQASLNGIYVKAKELDRGHNDFDAPIFAPPGFSHDAETCASDAESHASDGSTCQTGTGARIGDAESHASDAESHASNGGTGASDAQTHASDAW